jgi:hypothetical protein
MQQITIRGIDPEIEQEIRRSAKENHRAGISSLCRPCVIFSHETSP